MTERDTPTRLANIWGDTVDLKHLAGAMLIGIGLGFAFFRGGQEGLLHLYPDLGAGLNNAGALLVGIVGCLLAAVVSARLFPPKRTLSEQQFSEDDRERVLRELQVDLSVEAAYAQSMPEDIREEMKELQLDAVFRAPSENTDARKGAYHGSDSVD